MRKRKVMKKWKLWIAAASLMFLLCGCGDGKLSDFSKECGVDLTSGTLVSCEDTHGGFHGDGDLFAVISFSDDSVCEEMEQKEGWKELPLSQNLGTFVYQPYDENFSIPEIENGYYYFYDRNTKSTDPYDDSELLDRYSYNFTFAIYDMDSHTLYWCEIDT
jgi:hypothetical protein